MTITQGPTTAVIRSGDEVLGTYRFGPDLPKPYLIAVSAPDAIELLVSELGQPQVDETGAGNKVFIAVESAGLRDAPGGAEAGNKEFGEIVEIEAAQAGWLRLAGGAKWIHSRDVVPLKAMVTRIVNLSPSEIKDRAHPDYYDHPHHKGVWNSVDEVNGGKHWMEAGRITNVSVAAAQPSGDAVELAIVNHWLDVDGQPLVKEDCRITVSAERLFRYDITFTAIDRPITFEDTKEGMFGIRLPNSMREQFAHGPVVNADGLMGTKACWGRTSAWVDYVGPIGKHNFGVTIMDHPGNPRKSRYHVRDYGLFTINPFGQGAYTKGTDDERPAEPLSLKPGENIRFRYGLFIHRGDAVEGGVAEAFAAFAK